jgi:hypothetical protein
LPDHWKESIIVPIYKKGDKTDCSNYRGISLLPTSYTILSNILLSRLSPYVDDQIICIRQILDKKWEYNETLHQLFIDFKKAHDSVSGEVLYNILIEFGVPMKLVRLIKMCLYETYSKVRIGKYLSDTYPIQNGLKQGDALLSLLFNFALKYAIRMVQKTRWDVN